MCAGERAANTAQKTKAEGIPRSIELLEMIEREYGKYRAKIYFKKEDVPEAEEKLLDAIMQSYRQRIERES